MSLSFITLFYNYKKYNEENNKKHKTSTNKAIHLISIFIKLFINRKLILLGDGVFACFISTMYSAVNLISRLRINVNGKKGKKTKKPAKINSF